MVFNTTFNNSSVISRQSVLLVEESGENNLSEDTRLVIGTSRTVGSAKKFVRITSGFGGGEFTKTLRKVCTCQKLKFAFLLLEYCKIRECYAVANAFTIRNMYSLLLYMNCNSRKINRPTKNMTIYLDFNLLLTNRNLFSITFRLPR
jgi:hypothetical protein